MVDRSMCSKTKVTRLINLNLTRFFSAIAGPDRLDHYDPRPVNQLSWVTRVVAYISPHHITSCTQLLLSRCILSFNNREALISIIKATNNNKTILTLTISS